MKKISFKIKNFNLHFYDESFNQNSDFLISVNTRNQNYHVLIFLDSRGVSLKSENNLIAFFKKKFKKKRYLIISRPLEMTTWASLINFLKLNKKITYKYLITNMGFNDFTPKKRKFALNVKKQTKLFLEKKAKIEYLEKYTDKRDIKINLYNVNFSKNFVKNLNSQLPSKKLILMNTPPLKKKIIFTMRARPNSFFKMIKATIKFNKKIKTLSTINFLTFDNNDTYDGVHYTNGGYTKIFKALNELTFLNK
jgi:hypothetical protein